MSPSYFCCVGGGEGGCNPKDKSLLQNTLWYIYSVDCFRNVLNRIIQKWMVWLLQFWMKLQTENEHPKLYLFWMVLLASKIGCFGYYISGYSIFMIRSTYLNGINEGYGGERVKVNSKG